ncbi:MAG: glucose-6-phosphate isomerase [Sinobacteraceae bacterium]|nr:glucose-6-phosphate isomerase [Nevskiaceae bacterium]
MTERRSAMGDAAKASRVESAWQALELHAQRLVAAPAATLFDADPRRPEDFSIEAAGLLLDYARQRVDRPALDALYALADAVGLPEAIRAMYRGDLVNVTEQRAALHVALRQPPDAKIGGAGVEAEVQAERHRMLTFAEGVREGRLRSSTGAPFRLVVNIGIGGSDLGPAMVVEALRAFCGADLRVEFVSNVDGCTLADVLAVADPAATLFIVASKTFTTQETMANASRARAWLVDRLGLAAVPAHFAAVSVNAAAMDTFGVHPEYRFTMWDWVGGRYSLWSSIGLSIAIAIGPTQFQALLAGAHTMDQHFSEAPVAANLPVLMALLGVWNINLLRLPTLAILPYDSRLARFPAFLQQLDMESNGKRVSRDGAPLIRETAPVVWGEPGNNAQHSFFQLLHQGFPRAAMDFLLSARSSCGTDEQHQFALANGLAQAEAFLRGQHGSGIPSHKVHEGGRPVSLLLFDRVEPKTLGALVAAYEHKVYAQSVLWDINAFDQWGVELGKKLADSTLGYLRDPDGSSEAPASLRTALAVLRRWRRAVD